MHVYNTLVKNKEPFVPGEPDKVKMYVCGPTTYNYIHLGNARPIVVFDTIRKYLEYKGYHVDYIQNFTDIDDKIIRKASEEKEDPLALAKKYIAEYFQDAHALGVKDATLHPKVSEHIPEIVSMVKSLVDKGHAYVVDGDVYFDIRSFPDYGKLSGRSQDELQAGARVEVDQRKKDPMDFALWKAAKPGEPAWESPWGLGRPGWHIECSAMSLKYLGNSFDIHGGGYDLIFPHHENEIAQAEAATGAPFVKYWLHNGFITVNQEKMSKSLGNFFLVRDVLAKFPADVVRFFLLATHYRSPLDFDDVKLEENKKALERIKNTFRRLKEAIQKAETERLNQDYSDDAAEKLLAQLNSNKQSFEKAMDDDFNTALAIGVIFDMCREINTYIHHLGILPGDLDVLKKSWQLLKVLVEDILGIIRTAQLDSVQENDQSNGLVENLLNLLLEVRQNARNKKDWAMADLIRDRLKDEGIIIEDTPQGARWKR
ncbi:cysteine--tRNA ligase [Bacillota bacterium LX-D]|nr:cysteine--tRNA ligase [Bacillota bacterium LX-D]